MAKGEEVLRYGDAAMFEAQPIMREGDARVTPRVSLLQATPDPLGANAAGFRMYAGIPTYDLGDIDDEERTRYWEESLNTHLAAPWEFITFHFFIEGVTRAFTHQMVRQRTATYAQESLRFAVKRGFASEAALPPMVAQGGDEMVDRWNEVLTQIEEAYETLIGLGLPAEDARGILPHCVTTRLHYYTNFRNLVDTMGNRLCTQAQFEWRSVALGIIKAIKGHQAQYRCRQGFNHINIMTPAAWQFELLAAPVAKTFTPVCYKAGKCVFMGQLDRGCTIRDRVQAFSNAGVPSSLWSQDQTILPAHSRTVQSLSGINPVEWMANPWAGITQTEADRPQNG